MSLRCLALVVITILLWKLYIIKAVSTFTAFVLLNVCCCCHVCVCVCVCVYMCVCVCVCVCLLLSAVVTSCHVIPYQCLVGKEAM